MSQTIKIAESELAEINMLQKKFQEIVIVLGNLQVEKMELEEKEKKLKEEWASLKKLDASVLDRIIKTYGEGKLNMSDGTFTQTPKQ
jgi:predicted nuclease with TOPRIM domain